MSLWSKIKNVAKRVGSGISSAAKSVVKGVSSIVRGNIIGGVSDLVSAGSDFVEGFTSSGKTTSSISSSSVPQVQTVSQVGSGVVSAVSSSADNWKKYNQDTKLLRG